MCCNKNYQHKFHEKLKEGFLIHTDFLTTTIISLFYCCKKVFILMNARMIRKNLMKHHYLKKKDFYSHLNMEDITDVDYEQTKRVSKDFEIKNLGEYHDLYVPSDALCIMSLYLSICKS